jgi:uncharacterized protein YecE (DUF72 family)
MAGNILVGTASWTEATLIKSGRFYPREARTAEERLRYYAGQFPVVEVDSSFYALPSFNNSVLWVSAAVQLLVLEGRVAGSGWLGE